MGFLAIGVIVIAARNRFYIVTLFPGAGEGKGGGAVIIAQGKGGDREGIFMIGG